MEDRRIIQIAAAICGSDHQLYDGLRFTMEEGDKPLGRRAPAAREKQQRSRNVRTFASA